MDKKAWTKYNESWHKWTRGLGNLSFTSPTEAYQARVWFESEQALTETIDNLIEDYVESPIEEILLRAMVGQYINMGYDIEFVCDKSLKAKFACGIRTTPINTLVLVPQHPVGPYRVDFLVIASWSTPWTDPTQSTVIIECDGHEFHEKTKEQVAKDKKRERYIQSNSFSKVLRFSGSEIYNDPFECAAEIIGNLESVLEHNARKSKVEKCQGG